MVTLGHLPFFPFCGSYLLGGYNHPSIHMTHPASLVHHLMCNAWGNRVSIRCLRCLPGAQHIVSTCTCLIHPKFVYISRSAQLVMCISCVCKSVRNNILNVTERTNRGVCFQNSHKYMMIRQFFCLFIVRGFYSSKCSSL